LAITILTTPTLLSTDVTDTVDGKLTC